jgi:hypothetical protein
MSKAASRMMMGAAGAAAGEDPPSEYLVHDTFTRVDASSLGVTETGQTWTLRAGAFAISSGTAVTTAADSWATVNSGAADIEISGDVTQNGAANVAGFVYRVVSTSQRLMTGIRSNGIYIYVGFTAVASHAEAIDVYVPHSLRTVVNGSQIDAYLDDAETPNVSYTLTGADATTYATATAVGMRCNDTTVVGAVFDNLTVAAL